MQTKSKKPATRPAAKSVGQQLERFKAMAQEVGADESPDALNRAFARLDPKRKVAAKSVKPKRGG